MAWHAAGVLHLDIKPANIATTSTGDVVVLDAGVSRFTKKGSATVRGAVGTPGYIAPELQGNGRHVAVAACDVFSLGATYRAALDRWVRRSRGTAVCAWVRMPRCERDVGRRTDIRGAAAAAVLMLAVKECQAVVAANGVHHHATERWR